LEALGRQADLCGYLSAIYANTGRWERCVAEMEDSARAGDKQVRTWRKLAQAQWHAGRREEAYLTLHAALRTLGAKADLHLQLGLFHAAEDRYDLARQAFESAVEADCTHSDCHYYLALAAAAQGDPYGAVLSFQRAFDLRSDDLMLAHRLAVAARAAGEGGYHVTVRLPESAAPVNASQIRQLASYLCSESDFVEAFLSLPASQMDAELFGMLAGVLQTALAEHPRYADLHYHGARVFQRLGRTDAALHHARQAVAINERYVEALVLLARLEDRAGDARAAVEHARAAIACGADWPDLHCLAGEWLVRCNRPAEARRHLERALQLNRNYSPAAEALASLAA
jgi:tetratricopeptide (TPR) repeat protein